MITGNGILEFLFWFSLIFVFIGSINWLYVAIKPSDTGGFVGWIVGDKGSNASIAARSIFGVVGILSIILLAVSIIVAFKHRR